MSQKEQLSLSIKVFRTMSQKEQLSWAVVIPTYQRSQVLLRCLHFVSQQSLPAKEIIVVDASPNWQQTREQVMQNLVSQTPATTTWHYVPARQASSATQRNQGIELATADIIFLIDDDSFMYSECAAEVIHVYTHDTARQVAGVMPKLEPLPPNDLTQITDLNQKITTPGWQQTLTTIQVNLRSLAKRLIKDDDIFIPYDFTFPKYTLPANLQNLAVHTVPMFHGARMSYRREILAQVRFEETLERYAVNEDNDVCYRASRLGMLLQVLTARICHIQVAEGRLTRFTTTALWGLNQAVLHRFHSPDLKKFTQLFIKLLWRRLFTQTLKDILDRRWTLPSTRGIWFVFKHYETILAKTPEELRTWYPTFQQQLITQDKSVKESKKS
jgi:GT2 family glycosyltransferase